MLASSPSGILEFTDSRAEEMVQRFRALAALLKNPGGVPGTPMAVHLCNPRVRGFEAVFWPPQDQAGMWGTDTHAGETLIYKVKF